MSEIFESIREDVLNERIFEETIHDLVEDVYYEIYDAISQNLDKGREWNFNLENFIDDYFDYRFNDLFYEYFPDDEKKEIGFEDLFYGYFPDVYNDEEDDEFEYEIIEKDNEFWEGVAEIQVSKEIITRKFTGTAGIKDEDDLKFWVMNTFQGELLRYIRDGVEVLNDEDIVEDEAYYEDLYANQSLNCVSEFKNKYDLKSEKYKDGMKLIDFLRLSENDNVQVINNDGIKLNNPTDEKVKVCVYGGHILNSLPNNHITRTEILSSDEFVKKWFELREDKEKCLYHINLYDGCYGKGLLSFAYKNIKYTRDVIFPNRYVKKYFEPFKCSFNHPMINNFSVAFGEATDCAGYDLNMCYVQALKQVQQIPIIDNIPMTYEKAIKLFSLDKLVCLCEECYFGKIKFPSTFWYGEDVKKYNLKPIETFLITDFKPFDYNDFIKYLDAYEEPQNDELLSYNKLEQKREIVNGRNKWNETVIKRSLGSFITPAYKFNSSIMSYLEDLMNPSLKHHITYKPEQINFSHKFFHNVHFAMSNQYHHLLIDFINKYPVEAVYVDCLYVPVNQTIEPSPLYKLESYKESFKVNFSYKSYKKSPFHLITGTAGTGKTTYIKNLLSLLDDPLIVVPERRLSTVWAPFNNITTFQYLSKRHFVSNSRYVVIDEVYKFNTDLLSEFLGFCRYHELEVYLAGDALQLEQIDITKEKKRIYGMKPELVLKHNYRNNIDYKNVILFKNDKNELKQVFDTYLKRYLVDETDPNIFNEINYCYRTSDNTTQQKYDKLYQAFVFKHNIKTVYARCIKNNIINNKSYYNGVIYKLPQNFVISHKSTFTISNTYSIYATQGQTMEKIRLISDDEKYYYLTWRMLYVLISRLTFQTFS